MFESNSKFPKIFVYILSLLSILIFAGMFFSTKFVASVYFFAILISLIIFVLDRKYGSFLTNYKLTYLLVEVVNLIAIVSIVYYEFSKHSDTLNLFLILLIAIDLVLIFIDIFVLKNKDMTRQIDLIIDFVKLCSMICVITYFFGVSKLYFAIFAFVFECMNLTAKVISMLNGKKTAKSENEQKETTVEEMITSNRDVGDGE